MFYVDTKVATVYVVMMLFVLCYCKQKLYPFVIQFGQILYRAKPYYILNNLAIGHFNSTDEFIRSKLILYFMHGF